MWEIDGKLIDFTLHRFNFDDVALMPEYKRSLVHCDQQQFFTFGRRVSVVIEKHRLSEEGEGRINIHEFDEDKITPCHIKRFEMSCRLSGLRVVKSRSFRETIGYVVEITWLLKEKLRRLRETKTTMDMLDSVALYNEELTKRKMLSSFYYKMVSLMPGINSKAALRLGLKFSTFKVTHEKLESRFINR
jgi:hypothetical protein